MGRKPLWAFALLFCFVFQLRAQQVPLPPLWTETDYLVRLASSNSNAKFGFSHERRYFWANNVLALREGDRKNLPPYRVTVSKPFYTADKLSRWQVRYRRWGLELVEGEVSLLQGNPDTAQLWLDAKANSINDQRFYNVFADERKSRWNWFGVNYTFPFRHHEKRGELTLNFRYLTSQRFRSGWLWGTYYNGRLIGEVQFVSSRGIDFEAPSGKGFTIDMSLSIRQGNWKALAAVEGLLGWVRWKRLREVHALVDTGSFAQDPEGFVHSLPFLSGRERFVTLKRPFDRQWVLGLGYQKSRWLLGAMVAERLGKHNWHLGAVWSPTNYQRLFIGFQLPTKSASVGYFLPNFSALFLASHLDTSDSLALGFQVRLGF